MSENSMSDGERTRRAVMGDPFVERALNNADDFSMPLQHFINEHAWGSTWQRGGIDLKTRSLITVAFLTALGKSHELKGHLRGALRNGATREELREVLLHAAVYCGAPSAIEGFRVAKELFSELDPPRE